MEDDNTTRCSICLETYTNPKALPCIHTFCLQCLDRHCEIKKPNMSCPLCRKAFTIPPGGNINLPNNFFVVSQLSQVKPLTETATENDMPSSSKRIKLSGDWCEEHPDEQNRLYCFDCKMVTCPVCIVNQHRRHDLADVDKSAGLFRQQIKEVLDSMSSFGLRKLENIKQLDVTADYVVEKFTKVENEISQKYDQMISILQSNKIGLIEELSAYKGKILNKVEAEKDKIEQHFVITETFKMDVLEIMEKGTAREISRTVRDLQARAEEFVKIQDKRDGHKMRVEITFKSSHSAADRVKNFIGELVFEDEISAEKDLRKFDFSSFLKTPTLHTMLPRSHKRITGVTVIGGEVYLVRSKPHVDIYRVDHDVIFSSQFIWYYRLLFPESDSLKVIASCSHYNCLYAVDYAQDIIYRYNLTNNVITNWSVGTECSGLSITKGFSVLATLFEAHRIHEYTTDGNLIRNISLESGMQYPRHCIQLSTGNYVVSHIGFQHHRVCIVGQSGSMIQSYGGYPGTDVGLSLAVDVQDNILVADRKNNRVQLLSPTLTYLGDIAIPRYQLQSPYALCFDEEKCRLYIGEGDDDGDNYGRLFALRVNVDDNN